MLRKRMPKLRISEDLRSDLQVALGVVIVIVVIGLAYGMLDIAYTQLQASNRIAEYLSCKTDECTRAFETQHPDVIDRMNYLQGKGKYVPRAIHYR